MTNTEREISGTTVAAEIRREMKRLGITRPRLARCANSFNVTTARVNQALRGEAGWLKHWTVGALADWLEMVRRAWQF